MTDKPIIVERTFNAPASVLWTALTDRKEMRRWYFDLEAFEPRVGFRFQFYGGPSPENQYLHLCEVREVVPEKKLSYSWRYDGYPGDSLVTFELFPEGEATRLRLTHTGLETLEKGHVDFARTNFEQGWNAIINTLLPGYVSLTDKRNYHHSIQTTASIDVIIKALTEGISEWWTPEFTGSAKKEGDEFSVRFGNTHKTFSISQVIPGIRITWKCIDAFIDAEFLNNKSEWIDTNIHWEMSSTGSQSLLMLTHEGLTADKECYSLCEKGWNHYLDGPLKSYLEKLSST